MEPTKRENHRGIPWRELGIAWRDAGILLVLAAAAAFAFNALRPDGIPVIRYAPFDLLGPCPEIQEEIPLLLVKKLRPEDSHVRVLDVRMPWDFAAGHIPKSRPFPLYETAALEPGVVEELKQIPAGTWVVVVDETGGQTAKRALSALAAVGVRGLHVLEGGLSAWKNAGPLERLEIPTVEDLPVPLPSDARVVDARPEDAPGLPDTVKLPFDDLLPPEEETLAKLRRQKDAPIYVVSDRKLPSDPAGMRPIHPGWAVAAQLRALGFPRVFVVKKPVSPASGEIQPDAASTPADAAPAAGESNHD